MASTSKIKKGMTRKETENLASKTLTQLEQHGFDISNKGEVDRLVDATVKEFRGHERSEAEQEVYDFMQSKLHMSISGAGAAELWDPSDLEAPLIETKRGDTEAQNVQKFTENWVSKELSKQGINYEKEMEKYDAAKKAYAKSDGMDIDQLYVMKETIGNLHRAMNKLDANKYKKDVTAYLRTQPVVKAPGETFGRSRVHEYVNGFKKHVLQLNAIAYQAGQVAEGITPGRKTRTPSRKTRGEEMLARMKATPVRKIKFKGGRTVDVDALIASLSKEKKGKVRAREPVTMIARADAKKYTGKIVALRKKAKRQMAAAEKRAALKETRLAAFEVKKAKREAVREARKEKKVALKEAKLAALKKKKATRMAKTEKMAVVREARKATTEKRAALRKTRLAALNEKRADAKEARKKKGIALRKVRLAKQIELKTKQNAAKAEKIAELAEAKANRLVKIRKRKENVADAKRARQDSKKARFAALRAEKEAKVAEKRAEREEILANRKVAAEAVEKKRLAKLEAKEKVEEKKRPLDERTKRLIASMRLDVPESKLKIGVPKKKGKKKEIALTGRKAILHNNRELERLVSTLEERAPEISEWKKVAAKKSTYTEGQKEGARKRLAKFTKDYERAGELAGKTQKETQVDYDVRNRTNPILKRLRGANLDAKKNI